MRALIISTLSLSLLIGIWGLFYHYSDQTLHQMVSICEEHVMPAIEEEDWDTAYNTFTQQYDNWRNYQKKALYMLETEPINAANEGFAKTLMYIKAQDLSNSSGELLALQESLRLLHQSETITWNNIL